MGSKKKISIIIPVYNGEKYIERCIDSVLNQENFSVNDLEIILLNDGSKDNSLKILKQYADKYPKIIKIIDQKNIGVARTRNKGIGLSSGKYIIFIDQDDWIDADYCSVYYEAINSTDLDFVIGGYIRPDKNNRIRQKISPKNTMYAKYIIMAAWAKIHRTEFLKKNRITFLDNKFGEDNFFTVEEISCTKKWTQIKYVGYNWFYNEKSVSNTSSKGLEEGDVPSLISLLSNIAENKNKDNDTKLFQYYMLRTVVGYLLFSGRKAKVKNFIKAYETMFTWLEERFTDLYKNKYLPLGPSGEIFSTRVIIAMFVLLHKLRLVRVFARVYCRG